MNITGGSNLSLYEVQEAAEIVSSASDEDVNMIFGSVINDELKDELIVTVIATGFDEAKQAQQQAQANRRPNQSIQVNRPNYAVQDEQQNDYAQNAPQQANAPVMNNKLNHNKIVQMLMYQHLSVTVTVADNTYKTISPGHF